MKTIINRHFLINILIASCLCLAVMAFPDMAGAQGFADGDNCTVNMDDPPYVINTAGEPGLASRIALNVMYQVDNATENLFNGIVGDVEFRAAFGAAIALYIAFYGMTFLLGLMPIRIDDLVMRLVKLTIISAMVLNWDFFYEYVVNGINMLSLQIMNELMMASFNLAGLGSNPFDPSISISEGDALYNVAPLLALDAVLNLTFGLKFFSVVIAAAFQGPYGFVFAAILVIGFFNLMMFVIKALYVFLISIVVKSLLLGIAPIFLTFLLFNNTRNLFEGWLAQVINFTLQPIMLFSFLGIYLALFSAPLQALATADTCWAGIMNIAGSASAIQLPRIQPPGGSSLPHYGFQNDFPLDIGVALIFAFVAFMMSSFATFTEALAQQVTGGMIAIRGDYGVGAIGGMGSKLAGASGGGGGGGGGGKGLGHGQKGVASHANEQLMKINTR